MPFKNTKLYTHNLYTFIDNQKDSLFIENLQLRDYLRGK